jgi:hypothetical protein
MQTRPQKEKQEIRLILDPGVCGFQCMIRAKSLEGRKVCIEITGSECPSVKQLTALLGDLLLRDLFAPISRNPVFLLAEVAELSQAVLDEKMDAYEAIMGGLAAGMEPVGKLYDSQEYFVPEVLMCSNALYKGLEILRPHVQGTDAEAKGQVVIGTVEGNVAGDYMKDYARYPISWIKKEAEQNPVWIDEEMFSSFHCLWKPKCQSREDAYDYQSKGENCNKGK